eukprot:509022-Amphidinium_carterae.1
MRECLRNASLRGDVLAKTIMAVSVEHNMDDTMWKVREKFQLTHWLGRGVHTPILDWRKACT